MNQIDPRNLLVKIAKILRQLKIPYIVTGGIAVAVWGRPRFTADIDIIIELKEKDIPNLEKALKNISEVPYLDIEAMKEALKNYGEFNFIDGETGIKVDFWILKKDDQFDISRFKRKKTKIILGEKVYFISPEDLILIKLKWYQQSKSFKQLEDIESIIKFSDKKLDKKYLKKWAKILNVSPLFNKFFKK